MNYLLYIYLLANSILTGIEENNTTNPHDCLYTKISTVFLKVDNVCLVEIVSSEIVNDELNNNRSIEYKSKIKIIENFKGTSIDSLTFRCQKIFGLNEGDTLLIYGYSDSTKLTPKFSLCGGKSKIVGRNNKHLQIDSSLIYFFQNRRNLLKYELEILRYSKKENEKFNSKDYSVFTPVTIDHKSNLFVQDLNNVYYIRSGVKMAHVKVEINNFGNEINLTFLNKIPIKIRRKLKLELEENIKSYLRKQKEKNYKVDKKMISIESYLYPKKNVSPIDF